MKIKFICAVLIIAGMLSFNIAASSEHFNISLPDEYDTLYEGSSVSNMATRLDMEPQELKQYMEKNGVLMIGLSKDKTRQIRVMTEETEFSKLTEELSALSDESLDKFAKIVVEDDKTEYKYLKNGNIKYIKFSSCFKDSGGEYTVTQYITIHLGRIYRLCLYNGGDEPFPNADEIFKSFKLLDYQKPGLPAWAKALFVSGIALLSALCAAIVVGIVKEKVTEKRENLPKMHENPIDI